MAAKSKPVPVDSVQIEGDFSKGMTRDSMRGFIQAGGVYDARDFMLEQPGRAYKRGGYVLHSDTLPAIPSMVATIHIPTRVVAIVDGDLYNVTSEGLPEAIYAGGVGFSPGENPPESVGRLILCHPEALSRPKKVFTTGPLGTVTVDNLGGVPPYAAHSTVYSSRIVLGRGQDTDPVAGDTTQKNRLWFSESPDEEATWDTANKYVDCTHEITGLAAIQGMLLIFSPRFCERIIGGIPPGVVNPDGSDASDMVLQPVGAVGCLDARSIATIDNQVIFASEEGVYLTNGVGFDNLMENAERSGILSYWRSLFAEHEIRSICGGMLNRNFYFLSTFSTDGSQDNFVCYLPTKSWWRTTNTTVNMFAAGATEQETIEMYGALHNQPYVAKFSPLLKPMWSNSHDGDGTPIEPVLETRPFGSGPGLKAYGFGRLTYDMRADAGTPTLVVSELTGIEAEAVRAVPESPLPATTQAQRKRFSLFRDTQSLSLRFEQEGESAQTELFLTEVEYRPYGIPADGESPASNEYP